MTTYANWKHFCSQQLSNLTRNSDKFGYLGGFQWMNDIEFTKIRDSRRVENEMREIWASSDEKQRKSGRFHRSIKKSWWREVKLDTSLNLKHTKSEFYVQKKRKIQKRKKSSFEATQKKLEQVKEQKMHLFLRDTSRFLCDSRSILGVSVTQSESTIRGWISLNRIFYPFNLQPIESDSSTLTPKSSAREILPLERSSQLHL